MKELKNMTKQETINQIDKVINKIAPRYTFYGYTLDDIKQESFIICMDALDRYDEKRPLENFLSVHLSNRLKNFIRDNHFISYEDEKGRIIQPAQLENEHTIVDNKDDFGVSDESLDYKEMIKLINLKLPASMRFDYLKVINDVYVSKKRRDEIVTTITEILEEYGLKEMDNEKG